MATPSAPLPSTAGTNATLAALAGTRPARSETVDRLRTLIGFDTVSRNANLELIEWVEAFLAPLGFRMTRIADAHAPKANLIASIGPEDRPGYVLSGHTDVVPVDNQEWTSDPFVLRSEDGRHYGRGTADMKGFLACCLALAPEMAAAPLTRPLHFAFSYDEEVGCLGVRSLIEELKTWPVRPAGCFIGEPTSMTVVTSHKAKRSLRGHVIGTAAHSSLAPEAVNAIDYAALFLVRLREIGRRLATEGPFDDAFDVAFTTAHVGLIQGGEQLNIVPEHCRFDFEFRALPSVDVDALVDEICGYAERELLPEMRAKQPAADFTFEKISAFPGLDTDPGDPIVVLAKRLAGRNDHGKVAYGTEGGLFSVDGGIPTVVCGPGAIAQAHKADEFVEDRQLAACEGFIEGLIEHACGHYGVSS